MTCRRLHRFATLSLTLWLAACGSQGVPAPIENYGTGAPRAGAGTIAVRYDETVYDIAERYQLPVRDIVAENHLQPPYALQPGQRLRLPKPAEVTVRPGDSLFTIGRSYQVSEAELARTNGLSPPYNLQAGQRLRLPFAGRRGETVVARGPQAAPEPPVTRYASPPVYSAPPAPMGAPPYNNQPAYNSPVQAQPLGPAPSGGQTQMAGAEAMRVPPPGTKPRVPAQAVRPIPASTQPTVVPVVPRTAPAPSGKGTPSFAWPLRGEMLSGFGPKEGGLHNDGINIAAPSGTPVLASAPGTVVYAGNELKGYGTLVLIRHSNDWFSAYAHLDQAIVDKDMVVEAGQTVGTVGTSGGVRPAQLHFELRHRKDSLDPMKYLPR